MWIWARREEKQSSWKLCSWKRTQRKKGDYMGGHLSWRVSGSSHILSAQALGPNTGYTSPLCCLEAGKTNKRAVGSLNLFIRRTYMFSCSQSRAEKLDWKLHLWLDLWSPWWMLQREPSKQSSLMLHETTPYWGKGLAVRHRSQTASEWSGKVTREVKVKVLAA